MFAHLSRTSSSLDNWICALLHVATSHCRTLEPRNMALDRLHRINQVSLFSILLLAASESQAYGIKRNPRLVHHEEFDSFGSLDCMTPRNGPGRCIPLSDCPTLTQLLEKPNKQIISYIRNSTCGLLGSDRSISQLDLPIAFFSWVCCPGEVPFTRPTTKPTTKPPSGAAQRPPAHLLPKDCGISNVGRNRVVGGHEAPKGAWPWMAVLLYQFNRTGQLFFQCGGVLITNQHVLTASHCVHTGADLVGVRLGEHNLNSPDDDSHLQEIGVRRIIPHERFSLNPLANDVAVLQLERKVIFNDRVRPICLPLDNSLDSENLVGEKVYIAGWGLTKEGGNLSTVLKEAEVPIVSLADCIEAHKDVKNANVDATVTCTGYPEGGVGSCQGDSGGPLMRPVGRSDRFHLLGLVRSAVGCARPGFPAMFTRVDRYIDWILSKLQ